MKERRSYIKQVIWFWTFFLLSGLFAASFVWLIAAGYFTSLPTFEELENPKSNIASEVYTSDNHLLGNYFIQNRSNVGYNELSPNLVNALIATEDIRFEEHSGIDLKGLMRVLVKTIIFQQSSGGGSTITQQLAKNLFPRQKLSRLNLIIRKIKEWIIAVKLEKNYTKKEIIAMYLNTVPFGSNSFGIKSASRTFFNVTQDSLKVHEAAVLIGLLKAPTWYSPKRNKERATLRRNVVMHQMMRYGYLMKEEYDSLVALPIELKYTAQDHTAGRATYFREYLRGELNNWCQNHNKPDGTPYNLYKDGLKIYTTINSKMQRYAEEAVAEHLNGELQGQFFEHWKGMKNAPFWNLSKKEIDEIITLSMKRSKRYQVMFGKECGNCGRRGKFIREIEEEGTKYYVCQADDCGFVKQSIPIDSIENSFNRPVKMTVYSSRGEIDTTMTPMDSIRYYKYFLHSGFMSMDPHTGNVKAWVGGIDYKHFQFDHVKVGKRQVGSTFKPFVYTLAMQEKWPPCMKIPNVPITFHKGEYGLMESWTPKNSGKEFDGLMLSLKFGLANSINYMTAYLMKKFGPNAIINITQKMGITSYLDPYPALCLGTSDISVYEMVGAYSTFANKGVWTKPLVLNRIEDSKGNLLEEFIPERVEVMNEETVSLMLHMLMGVVDGVYSDEADKRIGTAVRLRFKYKFKGQIAGKTGTTQNYSDGWFVGVTPKLVSGAWVGCEDRSVHFRYMRLGQGANMALPIWALYMHKVYADNSLGYSEEDKFDMLSPKKLNVELNCTRYNYTHSNRFSDQPEDFDK